MRRRFIEDDPAAFRPVAPGHRTQIEAKVVTRYEVWCGCGWHKEFSNHRDAQDARLDHEEHEAE